MKKFFDWKIGIGFVLGVIVSIISSYFYVVSELKVIKEQKKADRERMELFMKEVRLEVENIYEVFHRVEGKLK